MATLPDFFSNTASTISKIEHRPFDRFVLGPFLIWYGLQSKSMTKLPRRIIIAGGLYQMIYAWQDYKKLMAAIKISPAKVLEVIKNDDSQIENRGLNGFSN